MVKRIMMTLVLSGFLNVGHSFAMENTNPEPQKKEARELTPTEKENAYRMWLMKQAMEKGTLPEAPTDVQNVIGGKLHALANPVLDGELVYTDKGKKTSFKIMDLVKEDGSIDISNKDIFGDASKYLLITTDPEKFFNVVPDGERLVILIAPKFLIEEKIGTTEKPFQPIMDRWKEDQAPIGIFWREESWPDESWYDYLIQSDLISISKNNLYENLRVGGAHWLPASSPFPMTYGTEHSEKFHVYFEQKLKK